MVPIPERRDRWLLSKDLDDILNGEPVSNTSPFKRVEGDDDDKHSPVSFGVSDCVYGSDSRGGGSD